MDDNFSIYVGVDKKIVILGIYMVNIVDVIKGIVCLFYYFEIGSNWNI